jgi:type II secretory pathway pseudopilin PulG
MIKTKKAAMFGLDARIALAIFGALSVISGAALYSAIQDAKATALFNDMNEVGKAWEQYMLDTGKDLPVSVENIRQRATNELISSTANGWKGPYLNYNQVVENDWIYHEKYGNITIPSTSNLEWGQDSSNQSWNYTDIQCNDTTIQCYITIQFGIKSLNIIKKVDSKIDNGDGSFNGKIRWYSSTDNYVIAYLYAPYKMPQ